MLQFKPITLTSLKEIKPYLNKQNFRTCDFTIGGIYMWIDYFNYEYCIANDILFIRGFAENEKRKPSFSVPIGSHTMSQKISLLKEYCNEYRQPLLLSAVPEEAKNEIEQAFACQVEPLRDWSDYLYSCEELVMLPGRKFNKKRNHVNKFNKTYVSIEYEAITLANLGEVKNFFNTFSVSNQKESPYFAYEESMVNRVLENFGELGLLGGVLRVENKIIAISLGEIVNDTMFIHIEKAFKEYSGAYETINQLFAAQAYTNHHMLYINREEDVGDEGLRRAKLSYNPNRLLTKYNINL